MSDSAPIAPGSPVPSTPHQRGLSPEDETVLRETMRRCSPSSVEAAVQFRKTGNPEHVPAIVIGVIERFVEPDLRPKLKEADDDLRIIEDLGVDSLTMMEIVVLVEDALKISISNDDLRSVRTLGDIKAFIDCRLRGLPPPKPTKFIPIEQIATVMPVQPPFLFLNEAAVNTVSATGKYKITGQEAFLQGHFKGNPVMPASLMLEALGQLAVLFLLEGMTTETGKMVAPNTIFFTGCEGVRAHRICRPGDTLVLTIKPKRIKMPLATFEGAIRVGSEKAAIAEEITLTFALADAPVAPVSTPASAPASAA